EMNSMRKNFILSDCAIFDWSYRYLSFRGQFLRRRATATDGEFAFDFRLVPICDPLGSVFTEGLHVFADQSRDRAHLAGAGEAVARTGEATRMRHAGRQ